MLNDKEACVLLNEVGTNDDEELPSRVQVWVIPHNYGMSNLPSVYSHFGIGNSQPFCKDTDYP